MSIKACKQPCWEVRCDECGNGDNEDAECWHHPTEDVAIEAAMDAEFSEVDGRWLCSDCRDALVKERSGVV